MKDRDEVSKIDVLDFTCTSSWIDENMRPNKHPLKGKRFLNTCKHKCLKVLLEKCALFVGRS